MSQQVRDAVARLNVKRAWDEDGLKIDLPYIPDDLTACAKAWDDHAGKHGWRRMCDSDGDWYGFERGGERRCVTAGHSGHDAASELRDRWELLGMVLKARGVV